MHPKASHLSPGLLAFGSQRMATSPQHVLQPNAHVVKPVLDDEFDEWMARFQKEWGVKGLAISVVRRVEENKDETGWSVETKGYGVRNEDGDPVTPDTIFSICSNSKLFTSLALGQLIHDPPPSLNLSTQLTWDTPVASILDDWKLQDPIASKESTIIDILSHRTGLPGHDFGYKRSGENSRDVVGKLRWLRPSIGFRTRLQYNGYMYMVAAEIVERVSGVKFTEYVERFILRRLPLTGSTYNGTYAKETGNMADGFGLTNWGAGVKEGEGWWKAVYKPLPLFVEGEHQDLVAGPGGLLMSVKDTAVWMQTLLLEGRHPVTREQIIPTEAIRKANSPVIPYRTKPEWSETSIKNYGQGQWMYSYRGHNIIEHKGGFSGWKSIFSRSPDDGIGITVMTNYELGGFNLNVVLHRLYDKLFALEEIDWEARYKSIVAPSVPSSPSLDPASNATDRPDFSGYTGSYSHPTYGTLELCDPSSNSFADHSPQCSEALSQLAKIIDSDFAQTNEVAPDLIAVLASEQYNHLQFKYVANSNGSKFTLSLFEVTHTPRNKSDIVILPASLTGVQFTSEFAFERDIARRKQNERPVGLAWGGGAWRSGEIGPATGESMWDRAEVYFKRVR